MKAGDLVVYREGEREFNALVFHVHELPEHLGEDGEPLLHLVIVDENPPRAGIDKEAPSAIPPAQRIRQAIDVVHESHEYSDEYKKKQGLPQGEDELSQMRAAAAAGPGRWSKVTERSPVMPSYLKGSQMAQVPSQEPAEHNLPGSVSEAEGAGEESGS